MNNLKTLSASLEILEQDQANKPEFNPANLKTEAKTLLESKEKSDKLTQKINEFVIQKLNALAPNGLPTDFPKDLDLDNKKDRESTAQFLGTLSPELKKDTNYTNLMDYIGELNALTDAYEQEVQQMIDSSGLKKFPRQARHRISPLDTKNFSGSFGKTLTKELDLDDNDGGFKALFTSYKQDIIAQTETSKIKENTEQEKQKIAFDSVKNNISQGFAMQLVEGSLKGDGLATNSASVNIINLSDNQIIGNTNITYSFYMGLDTATQNTGNDKYKIETYNPNPDVNTLGSRKQLKVTKIDSKATEETKPAEQSKDIISEEITEDNSFNSIKNKVESATSQQVTARLTKFLSEELKDSPRLRIPGKEIKRGSENIGALWIQKALNMINGSEVPAIDGKFGNKSLGAVKKFQEVQKLKKIDGLPGQETLTNMIKQLAIVSQAPDKKTKPIDQAANTQAPNSTSRKPKDEDKMGKKDATQSTASVEEEGDPEES